jgi:hypothetical protein
MRVQWTGRIQRGQSTAGEQAGPEGLPRYNGERPTGGGRYGDFAYDRVGGPTTTEASAIR